MIGIFGCDLQALNLAAGQALSGLSAQCHRVDRDDRN
jgi:hypothetical protein